MPKEKETSPADIVMVGIAQPLSLNRVERTPNMIAESGGAAQFAWEEFVYGRIRNPHTRDAYCRAVRRFLDACRSESLLLKRIAPAHVGRYIDLLPFAPSTRKLHLAALRHFFDRLVERHVVLINPAASVRGERYQVVEGKTPEIGVRDARRLLATLNTRNVVGLRDRAVIAILVYTAARIGAVAKLRRGDLLDSGDQYCLRLREKGGKQREIPVRVHRRRRVRGLSSDIPVISDDDPTDSTIDAEFDDGQ